MDNILLKFSNDPLAGRSRESVFQFLRERLKNRALVVYVFGSFAENNMNAASDIDLIIVCKTPLPFTERAGEFKDLFTSGIQFDILVYTPEEWRKIQNEKSVGFWKSVKSQMLEVTLR
jgi:predicted nucleotidyltransferase